MSLPTKLTLDLSLRNDLLPSTLRYDGMANRDSDSRKEASSRLELAPRWSSLHSVTRQRRFLGRSTSLRAFDGYSFARARARARERVDLLPSEFEGSCRELPIISA